MASLQGSEATQKFWERFGKTDALQTIECEITGKSLAEDVAIYFGLQVKNTIGGQLLDIDIKHMDAIALIKLSLLEVSAGLIAPYEIFIDYDNNELDFRQIGGESGRVTNIYHTIQSSSYVEKCSGVMVTGRDPLPYRKTEGITWKPIWGDDPTKIHVYDTTDMISNCNRDQFQQQATIAFVDPHLNTAYNDRIDNLYDIDSPFEKLQGYAIQRYSTSEYMNADVTIVDSGNKSRIPIRVAEGKPKDYQFPNIGKALFKAETVHTDMYGPECWTELAITPDSFTEYGIEIKIPEQFRFTTEYGQNIDNFVEVSGVYVIGSKLTECHGIVRSGKPSTAENTDIWVDVASARSEIFSLTQGKEYVIGYDPVVSETFKTPYLIIADGSRDTDKAIYGTECTYNIRPTSSVVEGKDPNEFLNLTGTIIPRDGTTGILVQEVWVVVELECPSITITDPKGKAGEIAAQLRYDLLPLIVVDPPPPIAFNGVIIDQTPQKRDNDPTATQDFENTPYELAMDEMDKGGGLNLHLSFMEEDEVKKLSKTLYDHMNNGDGIETVYICGPECEPILGGYGLSGGIINNIQYQYSDKGSYTISVTEGPHVVGDFAGGGLGVSFKEAEARSVGGTIIDDLGNGIHYKVRLDGFGDFIAFNMSQDVIRMGDQVQCTIHNLPIED